MIQRKKNIDYTVTGSCKKGFVVIPSHRGYDYAAQNLASFGYIVVSINANYQIGGIRNRIEPDAGLNLVRGRLVLSHLKSLYDWATVGGAPTELSENGDPDLFRGKIDFSQVGLMGHSRGGEGVRAALNQYLDPSLKSKKLAPYSETDWKSKIKDLKIRAVFEIGAVDGQTDFVLDAPGVVWNQILPWCDGDVMDLQGRGPFERMSIAKPAKESTAFQKSLEFVWGANHNFFNTEWTTDDEEWLTTKKDCSRQKRLAHTDTGSDAQVQIGLLSMSSFFRAHVGTKNQSDLVVQLLNRIFNSLMHPGEAMNALTRVDRVFTTGFAENETLVWDDLDISRATRKADGLKVQTDDWGSPKSTSVEWASSSNDLVLELPNTDSEQPVDVSNYATLDFRIENETKESVAMAIRLKDLAGKISNAVQVSDLTAYPLQYLSHEYIKAFQTVRVKLSAFDSVDLSKIQSVQFVFEKGTVGKVSLMQVRLAKSLGVGLASTQIIEKPLTDVMNNHAVIENSGEIALDVSTTRILPPNYTSEGVMQVTLVRDNAFSAGNAMPELTIDGKTFKRSTFLDSGNMNELTFEIKQSEFTNKMRKSKNKSASQTDFLQQLGPITYGTSGSRQKVQVQPR